jgi:uncharacterized protein (TIGR03067 family)
MRLPALLLVATLGLALVAASPGGDDAKKMQGVWDIVEYEVQSKPLPANVLKKVKAVFTGDKFKIDTGSPDVKESTFKLDSAKNPKQIDFAGEEKGAPVKMKGIYAFDGDSLKICLIVDPAARPTEFKTDEKTKSVRMVLKKEKSK